MFITSRKLSREQTDLFIEGIKWKENSVNTYKYLDRNVNLQTNKMHYTATLMLMIYKICVYPCNYTKAISNKKY